MKLLFENWREYLNEEKCWKGYSPGAKTGVKTKIGKSGERVNNCEPIDEEQYYEVDALDENEEYCPVCVEEQQIEEEKKPCKPSKGKRFAKRVDGKCVSHGQAGKAKDGTDRIQPGTKKADAYCARSAKIKKCKNPPCANTLSRKKWKCKGNKSIKEVGLYNPFNPRGNVDIKITLVKPNGDEVRVYDDDVEKLAEEDNHTGSPFLNMRILFPSTGR